MNENELYLNILERLSANGIHQYIDVFDSFNEFYTEPTSIADAYLGNRSYYIDKFLDVMEKNGHIKYMCDVNKEPTKWNYVFKVKARVTPLGIDFYQKLLINNLTMKSYKSQRRGMISTIVVASLALVISFINLIITISKKEVPQEEIMKLSRQVDTLKSVQKTLKNQKSYH